MAIFTSVDQITADLTRLRTLFVNLYFWGNAAGWVLIDAGVPGAGGAIVDAAERQFGRGAAPKAIILTHGHFDHVGALPHLLERWDVPVFAHRSEMAHLTGERDYPPPDPLVGKGALALLSFLYPHKATDFGERVVALPDDEQAPYMPGWRWLPTPGHTDGHVSLFRDADRCLIAGDAFVTVAQESLYEVLRQDEQVHGPPAYFTADWSAARTSVATLAKLRPTVAATGHGVPMRGAALTIGLATLVQQFDTIAIPAKDRVKRESPPPG